MGYIGYEFRLTSVADISFPKEKEVINLITLCSGLELDFRTVDKVAFYHNKIANDILNLTIDSTRQLHIHRADAKYGYLWFVCIYQIAKLVVKLGGGGVTYYDGDITTLLRNEEDLADFMEIFEIKDLYKYPYDIAKNMENFVNGNVSGASYPDEYGFNN